MLTIKVRPALTVRSISSRDLSSGTHTASETNYFSDMRKATTELNMSLLHVYLAQTQEKVWEYLDKPCDTLDKNKTPSYS